MAQVLSGQPVAQHLQEQLAPAIKQQPLSMGILLVGDNPASLNYIQRKQKLAAKLGIEVAFVQLPISATTSEVIEQIDQWNNDDQVNGMIVQLPLPDHIDRLVVLERICPYKDIDGLSPWSQGRLLSGQPMLIPATARGVVELLQYYQVPIQGQQVVVVGRSTLVGKPIALLLLSLGATVTIAHRQSTNLAHITHQADIVVVAAGHPGLITGQMVKSGATIIGVGLTATPDGLKGDVDWTSVEPVAAGISPVPGGVGPLTVTCLMQNLVQAAELMQQSGHHHSQNSDISD